MIGSALYVPRGEEHYVGTEPLDEDILRETHSGITIRPLEALRVIRLFGSIAPTSLCCLPPIGRLRIRGRRRRPIGFHAIFSLTNT